MKEDSYGIAGRGFMKHVCNMEKGAETSAMHANVLVLWSAPFGVCSGVRSAVFFPVLLWGVFSGAFRCLAALRFPLPYSSAAFPYI